MNEAGVFIKPLLLTIVFETAAAYLVGIRNRKDILLVVLLNILTNPVLVLFSLFLMYYEGVRTGRILTYAVLEPLVILIEYYFYRKYLTARKNPFVLSLILNLISILGGLLCQML